MLFKFKFPKNFFAKSLRNTAICSKMETKNLLLLWVGSLPFSFSPLSVACLVFTLEKQMVDALWLNFCFLLCYDADFINALVQICQDNP